MRNSQFSKHHKLWLQPIGILVLIFLISKIICPPALAQSTAKAGCGATSDGIIGEVIGGVAGGLIGNQIGKGDGKTAATIGGALLGVLAGGEAQKQMQKPDCKTANKTKAKPNPQDKSQEAAKPVAAPPQATTAGTAPITTGTIGAAPNAASTAPDPSAATVQSQYAAAKAMYETHPVYRQRIDKLMAQSLTDYDAALERDSTMETQFRDAGITTRYDTRIGEIRSWVAVNRNDVASKHVELTDRLRELAGLKRQQADDWSRQAVKSRTDTQTAIAATNSSAANTSSAATNAPQAVTQISAEFNETDTDTDLKRKRRFLFSLLTLESNTFDANDKDYQDGLKSIQTEFPEFNNEAVKFSTDKARHDALAEDYNADCQARILTDVEYKAKFMELVTKALADLDTSANMVAQSEQILKAKNIVTKYDAPLVALRDTITAKRAKNIYDFLFVMDVSRYINLVNWRADDANARLVASGEFFNSADATMTESEINKIIDSILLADSKSWVMHHYDRHSVRNVKVAKSDSNGQPAIIHADFTYNGGERGWIDAHYKANKLSCVTFFDFPGECRAVGKSRGADIATGLILDMFGGGSSSSGGGNSLCEQNPQLKQCGGSSYEPRYSPPAPPTAPISDFYADKHW